MREIKFRGKRVYNGKWVCGCFAEFVNYLDGDTKPGIQVTNQVPSGFDRMIPAFETELVEVIPESVGQYTGLKDKNGKEIYEGDIVECYAGEHYQGCWEYQKRVVVEYCWTQSMLEMLNCDQLEVIGNIYDNPELIPGVTHA